MAGRRRVPKGPQVDDLRPEYDPDDDERVRDALPARPIEQGIDRVGPPAPLRDDEVVCRSCRLAVRRGALGDAILLVCPDCYR